MSNFNLVVEFAKGKAEVYCIKRKIPEEIRDVAYNAYFQGMLDTNCEEYDLKKKNELLISERDRALADLARYRTPGAFKHEKVVEVVAAPIEPVGLFI